MNNIPERIAWNFLIHFTSRFKSSFSNEILIELKKICERFRKKMPFEKIPFSYVSTDT